MKVYRKSNNRFDDLIHVRFNNKDRLCTIGPDTPICDQEGQTQLPRMVVLAEQSFYGHLRNRKGANGEDIPNVEELLYLFWVSPTNPTNISPQLPQGVLCASPVITRGQSNWKTYKTVLMGKGLVPSDVVTTLKFGTYSTKKEPKAGMTDFVQKEATKEEAAYIKELKEWLFSEEGLRILTDAVGKVLEISNVIMISDSFSEREKEKKAFRDAFYGVPQLGFLEDSGAELLSLPGSKPTLDADTLSNVLQGLEEPQP